MSFAKTVHFLERISHRMSAVINRVGTAIIMMMMLLTTADVILRYVFNRPIEGAYEMTQLLMLLVVALALAYTQSTKRHISVDIISSRLSPRGEAFNDAVVYLVCLGICSLMAWRLLATAQVQQIREVVASRVVQVPVYPFYYALGFGVAVLCLVYIIDFLNSVLRMVKK